MRAPRETIWTRSSLTEAKHLILEAYLQWWLPTMVQQHEHIRILDGFAGPGVYRHDEHGSPLIAIETLLKQVPDPQQQARVSFLFIEEHKKRYRHLSTLLHRAYTLLNFYLIHGNFAQVMDERLAKIESTNTVLLPTLALLDPFGFSDIPISIIARLMRHPHNEVLITFMYEEINRFLTHSEEYVQHHLTALFGTDDWRLIDGEADREGQIWELYRRQLQALCNSPYICMFRMKNRKNTTDYFLIFVTHKRDHLEKMKDSFWQCDPRDGHTFVERISRHQLRLIPPEPDYPSLAQQLRFRFQGKTVSACEIDEYILTETAFRRKDGAHVLKHLEENGCIVVTSANPHRCPGSYTESECIQFLRTLAK